MASGQVDCANAAVRKLETENAEIRAEMEALELGASESVKTCLEVAKREKKCLKELLAWEKQKTKMQEDIAAEKQKISELQQELAQVDEATKEAEPENNMKHFEVDDDDDDEMEEGFLHNHEKCIKDQEEAADRQADYMYFTGVAQPSTRRALPLSSKKKPENNMKHFEVDDDDEMKEGFLHDHEKCIKAQEEAANRQADYMVQKYFSAFAQPSTTRALPLSSKKKPENTMKDFEINDYRIPDDIVAYYAIREVQSELPGNCSPTCPSKPQSPRVQYLCSMSDDD